MDIELRPLRLGEILDRIFQLYRARFALFLGIAGVSTILELLWNLIQIAEVRWMTKHHLTRQWATTVSTIPAWAILFAAAALCLAATNRAVAAIYDGEPTSIVKAFAALRRGWLRYIWVNTLAFFVAWGSIIVVVLVAVMATLFATRARSLGQANAITLVYGAIGLLVLFALPLCLWLTLRYSLAVPACIEEKLGALRVAQEERLSHPGHERAHPGASAHRDGCPGHNRERVHDARFCAYGASPWASFTRDNRLHFGRERA